MVSSTFHSVPVLQQPSTREDLKNLKGYLWFLCRLIQASSPLGLSACKDLLNTAKEVHPFLFLRIFKPLVFRQSPSLPNSKWPTSGAQLST
jgi:hypothetical protein